MNFFEDEIKRFVGQESYTDRKNISDNQNNNKKPTCVAEKPKPKPNTTKKK